MQIVIEIPEEVYKRIKLDYEYDARRMTNYEKIIANGIALPKGHSRLFDERDIVNGDYKIIGNTIYECEPVLGADKEGK